MIIEWFDSLWFRALQNFIVAAAIPVLVIYHCGSRHLWQQWSIIVASFLLLWAVWGTLLSIRWQPDVALLLASVATYALIRSLARLRSKAQVRHDN